jgi:hypothetical protein
LLELSRGKEGSHLMSKTIKVIGSILRLLIALISFAIYMQYLKLRSAIKRWLNKRAFKKKLRGLPPDLKEELIKAYSEVLKDTVKVPGLRQFMNLSQLRGQRTD